MSSTLLNGMEAYMCKGENDMIYALITNTAESNLHPIRYHHWPINTGLQHEVMTTICNMASDIFNGNLHWRGNWGKFGICSEFLTYAENVLKRAKEITGAVPGLYEYRVIYFKPDAPCVDVLHRFTQLERFEINDFYGEKVLQIRNPTVSDLYWGQQIRKHYETCQKYAMESKTLDAGKMRKNLAKWGYMLSAKYRKKFQTEEKAS